MAFRPGGVLVIVETTAAVGPILEHLPEFFFKHDAGFG